MERPIVIYNLDCENVVLNGPLIKVKSLKAMKETRQIAAILVQAPNGPMMLVFDLTKYYILRRIIQDIEIVFLDCYLGYHDGEFHFSSHLIWLYMDTIDYDFPNFYEFFVKLSKSRFVSLMENKIHPRDLFQIIRNMYKSGAGNLDVPKHDRDKLDSYYSTIMEMLSLVSEPFTIETPLGTFDMSSRRLMISSGEILFDNLVFRFGWACNRLMMIEAMKKIAQSALQNISGMIQRLQSEVNDL